MSVEVMESGQLVLVHAQEVGDATYYWVALSEREYDKSIYAALGGSYAPTIGGFFPVATLEQFEELLRAWANEKLGRDFLNAITDSGPESGFYWYMYGKQIKTNPHKWDLAVAFIFAWLYHKDPGLVRYDNVLQIIGATYLNHHERARKILEEIDDIVKEK